MAMRDEIYTAIMNGGATKESLLELTGTTEKGLSSQFTYLRMTGRCPMKNEDGTFKIVSQEEWDSHRATSKSPSGKALTPLERVEKAEKKEKLMATRYDAALKRAEAAPDNNLLQLKSQAAELNLQIASIELGITQQAADEAPPEVEETPEAEYEGEPEGDLE